MGGDDNETPQIDGINDYIDISAQDPIPIELEPATEALIELELFVTPY